MTEMKKKKLSYRHKQKKLTGNMQHIITNLLGMVRNEVLEGKDYLAVPMVMLVEGVLNGSDGPLLYPADELEKFPLVWNHKPVVVYHPQMDGKALSACDPEIIEEYKVGIIMNTTFDGKRLKAEAWLDPERLDIVDDRIIEALNNNQMIEVSTGVFTENEASAGDFNGTPYNAIARTLRPDHLAILPDQIGACSIEDGAGLLRMNAKQRTDILPILEQLNINADISHDEIWREVNETLRGAVTNDDDVWASDVYDDWFVYYRNNDMFKQSYIIKDGKAVFEGLPMPVEKVISYEEVKLITQNKEGDQTMDKQKMVDNLIANGKWSEDDKPFLMGLEEDKLAKMEAPEVNVEAPEAPAANAEAPEAPEAPVLNAADYLANAPAEVRDVLQEALLTQASKKTELIGNITANKKNVFTNDQLSSMSVIELNAIAALAKDETPESPKLDFSGQAPIGNVEGDDTPLEAPVMNFEPKKD